MVTKRYVMDNQKNGFQPKYSINDLTEKQFLLIRDLVGLTDSNYTLYNRMCNCNASQSHNVFLDASNSDLIIHHIRVEEREP